MLVEERKKIILEKLKINSMVTLTELIDEIVPLNQLLEETFKCLIRKES